MDTTLKTRSPRLVVAGILAIGMLAGGQSAQAADTYRSGPAVGVHADAAVTCTSGSARLLSALPQMGTSIGYERGQYVAWKYTIINAATGTAVWVDTSWRQARIYTAWYTYDYYGHATLQRSTYGALPDASWTMATGRYRVYTDYAWWTTAGWSYATARTDTYQISQNPVGIRYASLCSIGVL